MHGSLAVTAVHDRYLGVAPVSNRSLRESYHWARCTTLFNRWLKQPIKEEHKDPIWATAGCLAILAFSSINTAPAEESWPFGPRVELEWLRLGAGKMTLWHLVDPTRPGSVFRPLSETFASAHRTLHATGIDGIPAELVRLCGLDESSTKDNNPYYLVVQSLTGLLKTPSETMSQSKAIMSLGCTHLNFGYYLERKDPIALLLMCLWYTIVHGCVWWIDFRARYELPALCAYLRRYHKDNTALQKLIPRDGRWPSYIYLPETREVDS